MKLCVLETSLGRHERYVAVFIGKLAFERADPLAVKSVTIGNPDAAAERGRSPLRTGDAMRDHSAIQREFGFDDLLRADIENAECFALSYLRCALIKVPYAIPKLNHHIHGRRHANILELDRNSRLGCEGLRQSTVQNNVSSLLLDRCRASKFESFIRGRRGAPRRIGLNYKNANCARRSEGGYPSTKGANPFAKTMILARNTPRFRQKGWLCNCEEEQGSKEAAPCQKYNSVRFHRFVHNRYFLRACDR